MTKTRRRQANGRPVRIRVAITEDQHKRWQAAADANQVTLPRWIVEQLEDKPPAQVNRALVTEIRGYRLEAAGAFGNLNQLAKRAHQEGISLPGWLWTVAKVAAAVDAADTWITTHQ